MKSTKKTFYSIKFNLTPNYVQFNYDINFSHQSLSSYVLPIAVCEILIRLTIQSRLIPLFCGADGINIDAEYYSLLWKWRQMKFC